MTSPNFCPVCGLRLQRISESHYQCEAKHSHFLNPLPVVVALVPERSRDSPAECKLLVVRRKIAPHVGKLALPGGFVNLDESILQAASRELREETGLRIDPQLWTPLTFVSTPNSRQILNFVSVPPLDDVLSSFVPNIESSEVLLWNSLREGEEELCFPIHQSIATKFLHDRVMSIIGASKRLN